MVSASLYPLILTFSLKGKGLRRGRFIRFFFHANQYSCNIRAKTFCPENKGSQLLSKEEKREGQKTKKPTRELPCGLRIIV